MMFVTNVNYIIPKYNIKPHEKLHKLKIKLNFQTQFYNFI